MIIEKRMLASILGLIVRSPAILNSHCGTGADVYFGMVSGGAGVACFPCVTFGDDLPTEY